VKCNGTPADKQIQFQIKPQRGDRKARHHRKNHIITLHIVKFPNFTASKPSETISKVQKYEKNQTIPVSHDHLFNRIVQHSKA
jgi:hypothetical protein